MNINSIFKRKHKYLVTFYKPSRVRKYICTRTIGSALQFALKKSFKYGVFTITIIGQLNNNQNSSKMEKKSIFSSFIEKYKSQFIPEKDNTLKVSMGRKYLCAHE